MKKANPFYNAGLELIRISDLPSDEASMIIQSLSNEKIMKIHMGEYTFSDCITVRDYQRLMTLYNHDSYEQYFDSQF